MIYFHALSTIAEIRLLRDLKIILAEFGEILTMERMSRIVHRKMIDNFIILKLKYFLIQISGVLGFWLVWCLFVCSLACFLACLSMFIRVFVCGVI